MIFFVHLRPFCYFLVAQLRLSVTIKNPNKHSQPTKKQTNKPTPKTSKETKKTQTTKKKKKPARGKKLMRVLDQMSKASIVSRTIQKSGNKRLKYRY